MERAQRNVAPDTSAVAAGERDMIVGSVVHGGTRRSLFRSLGLVCRNVTRGQTPAGDGAPRRGDRSGHNRQVCAPLSSLSPLLPHLFLLYRFLRPGFPPRAPRSSPPFGGLCRTKWRMLRRREFGRPFLSAYPHLAALSLDLSAAPCTRRSLIARMIVSYFRGPSPRDVLQLIANVLDFSDEQRVQVRSFIRRLGE